MIYLRLLLDVVDPVRPVLTLLNCSRTSRNRSCREVVRTFLGMALIDRSVPTVLTVPGAE